MNIDDIMNEEVLPDINEPAVTQITVELQAEQQEKDNLEKEKAVANASGIKLKKDGTPAKKRGRKSNEEKKSSINLNGIGDNAPINNSNSIYTAKVASDFIEIASIKLISDEWKLSELEKATNIKAWADCFDYYGGVELTPPQNLMLNQLGIILTRAGAPVTASKLGLFKAWVSSKISKFKKGKKENAPVNSGENAIRKDNPSDIESKSISKTGD